ncbi:ABC transporter ATP-binding protein [Caldalkalibacillus mannanilyticus]|uniref:ABC transporter ATP-binding protein n=1 Tax=Caldalkalibacillus mannanilyticus TaxID=1418 RepID=UPI000A430A53|nr:ABC transporter ATP-binding protein [Caldalkalibacillus mannanilyticus]
MALLTVEELCKGFGKELAVKEVNFTLEEGECGALLGPNGAGKSTTLKMLTGILKPSKGNIIFDGKQNSDFRKLIGYLPQEPKMHNWMTGREALRFMGQLSHMPKEDLDQRIDELLFLVGIENAANRQVGTYSGGMKQRLGIAQAIIHRPKLVIMDEPVSA